MQRFQVPVQIRSVLDILQRRVSGRIEEPCTACSRHPISINDSDKCAVDALSILIIVIRVKNI